jgi:hypothetical protein
MSEAHNLTADEDAVFVDIFVRDMVMGSTRKASLDTGGGPANHNSHYPVISATGRYVAFESFASDLVDRDTNGVHDVFVRSLVAVT